MNNFIDKLIYHYNQPWLNIIATLLVNFKLLPFSIAIKLPILIYGKVYIHWLKGKIIIDSNDIYRGMIKLGRNNDFFKGIDNSSFINLAPNSLIIFKGPCSISNNYIIRVASNAKLILGEYTFFGASTKFICTEYITIGKYTRTAFESQFIDSNFHYILNEEKRVIERREGKIIVGDFVWIGNRTSINKGTILPNYTIVCANSLTNKDYTPIVEEKTMIGGSPAKPICKKLKRIYSTKIEKEISDYFKENPTKSQYSVEALNDELKSINYWFKEIM